MVSGPKKQLELGVAQKAKPIKNLVSRLHPCHGYFSLPKIWHTYHEHWIKCRKKSGNPFKYQELYGRTLGNLDSLSNQNISESLAKANHWNPTGDAKSLPNQLKSESFGEEEQIAVVGGALSP
jgi:hypothetical protein